MLFKGQCVDGGDNEGCAGGVGHADTHLLMGGDSGGDSKTSVDRQQAVSQQRLRRMREGQRRRRRQLERGEVGQGRPRIFSPADERVKEDDVVSHADVFGGSRSGGAPNRHCAGRGLPSRAPVYVLAGNGGAGFTHGFPKTLPGWTVKAFEVSHGQRGLDALGMLIVHAGS